MIWDVLLKRWLARSFIHFNIIFVDIWRSIGPPIYESFLIQPFDGKVAPKATFSSFLIKTTLFLLNDGLRTPTNWKSYHHKPHHNECFFQLARLKNFDNRRKKIFPKQYFSSDGDSQLVLEQTNIGNFLTKWLFICPFFPHFLPVIEDLVYKMNFI